MFCDMFAQEASLSEKETHREKNLRRIDRQYRPDIEISPVHRAF